MNKKEQELNDLSARLLELLIKEGGMVNIRGRLYKVTNKGIVSNAVRKMLKGLKKSNEDKKSEFE